MHQAPQKTQLRLRSIQTHCRRDTGEKLANWSGLDYEVACKPPDLNSHDTRGSRRCSRVEMLPEHLVVPDPSSKRDCNFVKKSAMFESLLRISRTTKKSSSSSDMRQRAIDVLLTHNACLTADSGSNF